MRLSKFLCFRTASVSDMMKTAAGAPTGFDALRLGLSLVILFSHTSWILSATSHGMVDLPDAVHRAFPEVRGVFRTLSASTVPMFFALSGFLVAASSERNQNAAVFLSFRALRILPALAVEVVLSAAVLGPALTSFPLSDYVLDPRFRTYFLNIVGLVSFELPGVFEKNPVQHIVNMNLWTLPGEFYCYAWLTLLMVTGILARREILLGLMLVSYGAIVVLAQLGKLEVLPNENFATFFLVVFFLFGSLAYKWKEYLRFNALTAILCTAIVFFVMSHRSMTLLSPVFVVYLTAVIGCLSVPFPNFLRKNDYSYGIYLYGFPISQALVAAYPWIVEFKWPGRFACFALTIAFAAASWHLIERYPLRLKRQVKARLERKPIGAVVPSGPERVLP